MTTEKLQHEFEALINEMLATHDKHIANQVPSEDAPDPGPQANVVLDGIPDWSEGTEQLATMSEDDIYGHLGLSDIGKKIPGFNDTEDPDGVIDPWLDPGWFTNSKNKTSPLTLRWHQLVGIFKMLINVFESKPVLLMDEVGLGKTIQIMGLICMINYFRDFFDKHRKFPGYFGKYLYNFLQHLLISLYL